MKRRHHFLVRDKLPANIPVELDPSEAHHAHKVLRLAKGDHITLHNEDGSTQEATIAEVSSGLVRVEPIEGTFSSAPLESQHLQLALGVTKRSAWELTLRALGEVGVTSVQPILSARSVVKIEPGSTPERWRRVVDQSVKQSKRHVPLQLLPALALTKESLINLSPSTHILAGFEADAPLLVEFLPSLPRSGDIALWVGPEGGFSPKETRMLRAYLKPLNIVSLGPYTLRAETAAITGAALLSQWQHSRKP